MDTETDNLLRGIILIVLLFAFLGMVAWAWSKKRKKDFEFMGELALDDDDKTHISTQKASQSTTQTTKITEG